MRKNVLKTAVACMAVCLAAGLVVVGANGTAKADEPEVIANYTFEDDEVGDWRDNGVGFEIVEGKDSNAGEYLGEAPSEGNKCLKVDRNGNDWWGKNGAQFDLKKLTIGKKYVVSVDVSHDGDEVPEKEYQALRGMKIGTYCVDGDSGTDYNNKTQEWYQIGNMVSVEKGDWVRISGEITLKEDVAELGDYYLYIQMMYPEVVGTNGTDYKDPNKEEYYIDNFVIKEWVAPTPTPEPTAEPTPTPEPVVTTTPAPVVATEAPVVIPEDEGLDIGYEEVVKKVMYVVTGKDTVEVKGFDESASKLTIPATVTIEGYTYKVTSIAAKAFKGEDIKNLTIGANVTNIGKQAFAGCKSLKKITVKSTVIKKIGSKAFSKINAKATVKVPKKNKKAYTKLFKKAGLPKKAKVK